MSNLRIIGLIVGIFGLILTFRIYRGPRWRRTNFLLFGFFSFFLVIVCLNPDLINSISGMFALQKEQRGRLIALLIFSNIILWYLLMYFKTKLDDHKHQFDLLVRNLSHDQDQDLLRSYIADKEIMIIIPAYNEQTCIKNVLERVPHSINKMKVGVVVVDDGSSDNTFEEVKRVGFLAVKNKINRGQGGATRLGYDILMQNNHVKVGVTMDADGQHLPEDLDKLIKPVLENKLDLVLGSRILGSKEKGTLLRSMGVAFFSRMINFLTGLKLTDCSSGFKSFNINKMKALSLREDQFQAAEVIIEAAKRGLRIGEVPITILDRKHGKSKKGKDWQYGLGFTKTIFKSWWRA